MKWPKGTAALSVALFGRTFDASHEEDGYTARKGDEEYVVLGAGPVGLWQAVQLKVRLPSADVKVYEKRQSYTREHMVRLGSDALWWSVGHDLPEMKTVFDVQRGGHGMKLKELEGLLRTAAEQLGVTFIEQNIQDGNELLALHPHAVAIIGADGRHSVLRETLFVQPDANAGPAAARSAAPEVKSPNEPSSGSCTTSEAPSTAGNSREAQEQIQARVIEHTIYVNFSLEGDEALKAHNLEGGALQNIVFNAADSVLYAGHHPVRLVVGRKHEGKVSITAIFFVDHKTAQSMSTCRKTGGLGPGRITGDARVPPTLAADIRRYLAHRFGEDTVDADQLQLIYVAIDRYCSNVIAQARGATGVFLVGDACFGVPYFRALTNGLKCASTLAQYLAMPGVSPATAVRAYRWYVFRLWQQAVSAAEATGLGSMAVGGIVGLGQTLVGAQGAEEEEAAEEERKAQEAAEEEDRELVERGLCNHREEEEAGGGAAATDVEDPFGQRRGWGLSTLDSAMAPITGKQTYQFGDLTKAVGGGAVDLTMAGVAGGRVVVGKSVECGVKLASDTLHGFVNFTGLKL